MISRQNSNEIQPRRTMIRYVGQFPEKITRKIRGRLLRILSRSVDFLDSISLSLLSTRACTPVENRSRGSISDLRISKGKGSLKNGWNRVFTRVSSSSMFHPCPVPGSPNHDSPSVTSLQHISRSRLFDLLVLTTHH